MTSLARLGCQQTILSWFLWLFCLDCCFDELCSVYICRKIGKDVFVELDVGSDNNFNETQIRDVLFSVVKEGTIASYDTSVKGFQFRRLGEGMFSFLSLI